MKTKLLSLCLLLVCTSGCDSLGSACVSVGACAPPPPPPSLALDVLVDDSLPKQLSQKHVEHFAGVTAGIFQERNGLLRVWLLADDLEQTRVIYSERFAGPAQAGVVARRAYDERLAHELPKYLTRVAQEHLGKTPRTRSPIASGITKVALSAAPSGMERHIAVLTDLLEEDLFHMECRPLPSPEQFVQGMHDHGLLRPDALRGLHVVFGYFEVAPSLQGCRQTPERFTKTVTLWEAAIKAGDATVLLRTGELAPTDFQLRRQE